MTLALATVAVVAVWVTGYFWIADRREASAARRPPQEVDVLVNGGCHPDRVVLRRGRPIRLRVSRTSDGESWWDDLEFPYARILREVPEGETITLDVAPLPAGEYAYFCGQGTMRGTLVVQDEETD